MGGVARRSDSGREGRWGGLSRNRTIHPSAIGACPSREGTIVIERGAATRQESSEAPEADQLKPPAEVYS